MDLELVPDWAPERVWDKVLNRRLERVLVKVQ